MILPRDHNDVEVELYEFLVGVRNMSTAHIYAKLDTVVDKFIVAYVFEMGNTRKDAQVALGLSKVTIWKRIKAIRKALSKPS